MYQVVCIVEEVLIGVETFKDVLVQVIQAISGSCVLANMIQVDIVCENSESAAYAFTYGPGLYVFTVVKDYLVTIPF